MAMIPSSTADAVRDRRIERVEPLVSPQALLDELPLSDEHTDVVLHGREQIHAVLDGEDDRLLVIVGPCSVHDPDATLEYAERLSAAAAGWREEILVAMRVYFEKPRTTTGWKGLINDPRLDGSGEVNLGLRLARQVLLGVLSRGLPVGCEFLDPIIPQYISDAVSWGAIGARTVESQIHRQLGSGLSMPVGFKNRTDGNVQVAVDAVRAAAARHAFTGIDVHGVPAVHHTRGNRDCHIILRGGKSAPNYDAASVDRALALLRAAGLPERAMIDFSHDNSGKDASRQPDVAAEVGRQIAAGNRAIVGAMLESFLVSGRQELGGERLVYGQSITDACLDWERTVEVLEGLAEAVKARRRACEVRIAVIGVGLIGGSVALAARERLGAEVRGHDPGPHIMRQALERGAITTACESPAEAVSGADAVFVAVPVGGLPSAVRATLDAAGPECVVTDVGSTKRAVTAAAADPRFVGGHPLAGAETSGIEHARADLFEGATWYLTPGPDTSGVLYERLHRLLRELGARPFALEAEAHDRIMATVSHLPHVLANVLVGQAVEALNAGHTHLPAIGPSFRDATRVAGAPANIWTDIYLANADALTGAIDDAIERLRDARDALGADRREWISDWGRAARAQRDLLLAAQLKVGPLFELRVSVPNQPGVVAQVALELGRAGVNIADMALYPAPDMSEGVIALWIAGDAVTRAQELIEGLGFPVARA